MKITLLSLESTLTILTSNFPFVPRDGEYCGYLYNLSSMFLFRFQFLKTYQSSTVLQQASCLNSLLKSQESPFFEISQMNEQ